MRKRKPPTAEEFAAWRDNPVTQWVLQGCRNAAEDNRQLWIDQTWSTGTCDEKALTELRTRADAYLALAEGTYEDFLAEHEDMETQ